MFQLLYNLIIRFFLILNFLGSENIANANSISTLDVSAEVAPACSLTANNIAFGNYTANILNATTTISIKCTKGTAYTIEIDQGSNSKSATNLRKMISNNNLLTYFLYQDITRTKIWGNTNNAITGIGDGQTQSFIVYGQIPQNQHLPAGNYSDTLNILASWRNTKPSLSYQLSLKIKALTTLPLQ